MSRGWVLIFFCYLVWFLWSLRPQHALRLPGHRRGVRRCWHQSHRVHLGLAPPAAPFARPQSLRLDVLIRLVLLCGAQRPWLRLRPLLHRARPRGRRRRRQARAPRARVKYRTTRRGFDRYAVPGRGPLPRRGKRRRLLSPRLSPLRLSDRRLPRFRLWRGLGGGLWPYAHG